MNLEELQIIISVQSDQVQSQVNSVIGQINNLNNSVAASTAGIATSFGGMTSMLSSVAIGAALGKSIQSGMSQATRAIKTEMNQVNQEMQNSMRATSAAVNQEVQKINSQLAKGQSINVKVNSEAHMDTSQAQQDLNLLGAAFDKVINNMANSIQKLINIAPIKSESESMFDRPLATLDKSSFDGFKMNETSNIAGEKDGEYEVSFGMKDAENNWEQFIEMIKASVRGMQTEFEMFGRRGSMYPTGDGGRTTQRPADYEDRLRGLHQGGGSGSGSGGSGGSGGPAGRSGQYDTDDDVPAINELSNVMTGLNNRISTAIGSMQRYFNRTQTNAANPTADSNNTSSAFQRMNETLSDIKEEVNRIKLHLFTHLNGGGGGGNPLPGPGGAGGASGASLGAMGMGAMLRNYFAALGIGLIIKASITDAMEAVESENLFSAVFKGQEQAMRNWTNGLSTGSGQQMYNTGSNTNLKVDQNLGLNPFELRENSAYMFAMTTSMGLAQQEAMGLSQDMSILANDMASFYNLSSGEAFDKLRAGLSGETEPLKRLGIIVNETATKQYAYTNGIAKQGEVLSETQKVMARYGIIMRDTATAQGDLARTINSPSNQLRLLMTQLEMLRVNLGLAFMPIVKVILPMLVSLVNHINVAMQYVAAFTHLLFGGNTNTKTTDTAKANTKVAESLGKISTEAEKAKGSLQGFDEINQLNYQEAKPAGSTDIGEGITPTMPGGSGEELTGWTNATDEMKKKAAEAVAFFKEKFGSLSGVFDKVKESLKAIWENPSLQSAVKSFGGILADLGVILIKSFGVFFDLINPDKNPVMKIFLGILDLVLKALKGILDYLAGDGFFIVEAFLKTWALIWVTNKIFLVGEAITGVITLLKTGGLVGLIAKIFDSALLTTFGANMAKLGPGFTGFGTWIAGAFAGIGTFFAGLWASILGFLAPIGAAITGVIGGIAAALGISFGAAVALVVAAVVAIVAVIWIIVANWDEIMIWFAEKWEDLKKWGTEAWEGIKEAWSAAGEWFGEVWDGIKESGSKFWTGLKDTASESWEATKEAWDVSKQWFSDTWDTIKETGNNFWTNLKETGSDAWEGTKEAWDASKQWFSDTWDTVKTSGGIFWGWLKDTGSSAWDGTKKAWDATTGFFGGVWKTVTDSGSTFWTGMKSTGTGAWDGIKLGWDKAEGFFSTTWANISTNTGKVWGGIKTSISDAFTGVKDVFNGIVTFVSGTFKTNWGKAWDGVVSSFKTIVTGIGNVFKVPLNFIIDGINLFIAGVNKIKVPDWVPIVGGNGFSIQKIPKLAQGGIVSKSTIAEIGEAGTEAVIPLENTSFVQKFSQAIANEVGEAVKAVTSISGNGQNVEVTLELNGMELGKALAPIMQKINKKTGLVVF
jgi:hypothetical protein